MTKLSLPLFAHSTLVNGSDIQITAAPANFDNNPDIVKAISLFGHAAWCTMTDPDGQESFFAFFPIKTENQENNMWGLTRFTSLGPGARGERYVVWMTLLQRDQLERIGWDTRRIAISLPNSYPEQKVVGNLEIDFSSATRDPIIDSFLAKFGSLPDIGNAKTFAGEIIFQNMNGLGAYFGLWHQLGTEGRRNLSFCTFAGIEKKLGGIFDVVFGKAPNRIIRQQKRLRLSILPDGKDGFMTKVIEEAGPVTFAMSPPITARALREPAPPIKVRGHFFRNLFTKKS